MYVWLQAWLDLSVTIDLIYFRVFLFCRKEIVLSTEWVHPKQKKSTAALVEIDYQKTNLKKIGKIFQNVPTLYWLRLAAGWIKTAGEAMIQASAKCPHWILIFVYFHFRGKSHLHVVQLLKGSGSQPTLLVQWRPTSALKPQSSMSSIPSSSKSSQLSVTFENERPATVSRCSSMASKALSFSSDLFMNGTGYNKNDLRSLSRQFKIQVQYTVCVQIINVDFKGTF